MSVAMKLSYKQDIKDPLVTQAPVTLLMQGDNQANVIELTLMDGASPASLSGYTATVYLQRADGVRVRCPGSVSGNVATVPLQAECYSVPGQYAAIMKLSGPNELRTVLRLAGYVESDGQGVIIDPSGSIPSYEALERIIQELEDALQQAETAISGANAAAQNATTAAGAANTAAGAANTAAGNATKATSRANTAAASIEGLTVEASDVAYNQPATATVTDVEGHKHIAFGLRQGVPGAVPNITFTGETGEPNTDVVITQSGPPEAPVVNLKIPQGVPGTGNVSTVDSVGTDSGGNVELSAVRYVAQALEDAQKVQARKNIGVDGQVYPCTAQALEAMSQEQQAELYAQGYRAIVATYNETTTMHALAADGSLAWVGCNQDTTNLLDNPDFAIAQAGYNGYHGAIKYVCDRWTTRNANVNLSGKTLTYSASISEGVPISVILLIQKIGDLKRLQGKNVTFAIKASGISVSSGEQFYMADSLFSVAGTGKNVAIQNGVNVYNFTAAESLTTDAAVIVWLPVNTTDQITASITIDEIALYEGEYTADTLPPWEVPNKTLETLKCQHFAQILSSNSVNALDLRPTMRLSNPTITQISDGKYLYSCDL